MDNNPYAEAFQRVTDSLRSPNLSHDMPLERPTREQEIVDAIDRKVLGWLALKPAIDY